MLRSTLIPLVLLTTASTLFAAGVTTLAGTGRPGYSGDGGPAVKATVGEPFGLTLGPDGALYVCETTNHVIRRVDLKTGKAVVEFDEGVTAPDALIAQIMQQFRRNRDRRRKRTSGRKRDDGQYREGMARHRREHLKLS